ncbi:hypothetical protein ACQR7C_15645 [Salmonella enterica]
MQKAAVKNSQQPPTERKAVLFEDALRRTQMKYAEIIRRLADN